MKDRVVKFLEAQTEGVTVGQILSGADLPDPAAAWEAVNELEADGRVTLSRAEPKGKWLVELKR